MLFASCILINGRDQRSGGPLFIDFQYDYIEPCNICTCKPIDAQYHRLTFTQALVRILVVLVLQKMIPTYGLFIKLIVQILLTTCIFVNNLYVEYNTHYCNRLLASKGFSFIYTHAAILMQRKILMHARCEYLRNYNMYLCKSFVFKEAKQNII